MKEIEGLHGCYLLHSNDPRFKGRPYIGYTVDPVRRIGQHNGGHDKGGARRRVSELSGIYYVSYFMSLMRSLFFTLDFFSKLI